MNDPKKNKAVELNDEQLVRVIGGMGVQIVEVPEEEPTDDDMIHTNIVMPPLPGVNDH